MKTDTGSGMSHGEASSWISTKIYAMRDKLWETVLKGQINVHLVSDKIPIQDYQESDWDMDLVLGAYRLKKHATSEFMFACDDMGLINLGLHDGPGIINGSEEARKGDGVYVTRKTLSDSAREHSAVTESFDYLLRRDGILQSTGRNGSEYHDSNFVDFILDHRPAYKEAQYSFKVSKAQALLASLDKRLEEQARIVRDRH